MKKFRVHHILCTVLYRGEGYSGTFCDNMTQKVRELKADPDEQFTKASGDEFANDRAILS